MSIILQLWDVLASCEITGSADSSIKNAVPNDLSAILSSANIRRIYTNGKTSKNYYKRFSEEITGRGSVCLPSTSPANAACLSTGSSTHGKSSPSNVSAPVPPPLGIQHRRGRYGDNRGDSYQYLRLNAA